MQHYVILYYVVYNKVNLTFFANIFEIFEILQNGFLAAAYLFIFTALASKGISTQPHP